MTTTLQFQDDGGSWIDIPALLGLDAPNPRHYYRVEYDNGDFMLFTAEGVLGGSSVSDDGEGTDVRFDLNDIEIIERGNKFDFCEAD